MSIGLEKLTLLKDIEEGNQIFLALTNDKNFEGSDVNFCSVLSK